MADEPFQEDDLWDEKSLPRPSGMGPQDDAPELPEPDLSPPDVGGLDPVVEAGPTLPPPGFAPDGLQQEVPQPDMLTPLPGQENAPFPTADGGQDQGGAEGDSIQQLVTIGERLAEAVEEINDKLEDVIEKLEGVGTFGA